MNTPQWERAKAIFDTALELDSEQRSSYLLRECGDDTTLRHEVESLLKADAAAGSFLDPSWLAPFAPFAAPTPLPDFQLVPGDVVSGRFKIVRPLGDGGMGRVYEAHDSVLGVQVALKTLRPEIAGNPEVLFRFRQEVRIAHRITHPNVCRTFHLDHELRQTGADPGSSIDLTFLTMEFLEGETLQQRLKRTGRIDTAEAYFIARQMADAMEAAHHIGIIHRDIKPGNVMICPARSGIEQEARVVITDFGLAKFETDAPNNDITSLSQPGRAMGTLSYMSPEQLQGSEIGPATDIYAFGLVLYEMVTGVKAFPDSTTMVAAYRRTVTPPPSPRSIVPDLPMAWERAILGCLACDADQRFASPAEVIAALEDHTTGSFKTPGRRARTVTSSSRKFPRLLLWLVPVVVVVSCFGLALRFYKVSNNPTMSAGSSVYLPPVRNHSSERNFRNVTDLLQAAVAQSAHVTVLDNGRTGDLLQLMNKLPGSIPDDESAREVALRAGASRVIFSSIDAQANGYRLTLDMQQPDSTPSRYRNHWTHSWTWQASESGAVISPELLHVVRDASDWVRSTLGESGEDLARLNAPPEDATTSNWNALAEYSKAMQLSQQQHTADAIFALQNALKMDPQFALAYARMGDMMVSQNRYVEGMAAYKKALDAENQQRLTRHERDRIRGIYALDTLDNQTAEEVFRDATMYYPQDYLGWFYRGDALLMLGRLPEATASMEKALSVNSGSKSAMYALGSYQLMEGDTAGARRNSATLRSMKDGRAFALCLEAETAFVEGRYAESETMLEELWQEPASPARISGLLQLAHVQAERGEGDAAKATLTRAMAEDKRDGLAAEGALKQMNRAWLECSAGEDEACLRDEAASLAVDSGFEATRTASELLAQSLPRAGASAAKEMRRRLVAIESSLPKEDLGPASAILHAEVHGEVLMSEGRISDGLVSLRKAALLDAPTEFKPYLLFGLETAISKEPSTEKSAALRQEADHMYAAIAAAPAYLWYRVNWYAPGFYANSLSSWMRLRARDASPPDVAATTATQTLAALRPKEVLRPPTRVGQTNATLH